MNTLAPISMRTYLGSLLFLLCSICGLSAQNSADCRSAIPVCADAPTFAAADGSGDIDDFDPNQITQSGCLEKGSVSSDNIENNTSWYVFRAGTDGQIGFDIEALPASGNTITAEWDFALYGPDVSCAEISSGTAQPIRCNYETNNTRFTGVGVNPENGQRGEPPLTQNQNTYDDWLQVAAGEVYYLLINNFNTNFNGDPEPYSLTFTGSSVDADQNNALDCSLRDEYLGQDITACEGDPDIVLTAANSPAGPNISNITWSYDDNDDGNPIVVASGPAETEYTVSSPDSGRYFAVVENSAGQSYADDILIQFNGPPVFDRVEVLSELSDNNTVQVFVQGNGRYEYAVNGGDFQDSPIFQDVPPGLNTVLIDDKDGCGSVGPEQFLVVGYPKYFTPNGDGIHDFWNILGIETLENPVVFIFDRYGKLLKQLDDITLGWDGTFNGRRLPSTDYWFRLEYTADLNGTPTPQVLQSHFSLRR
ncbi:MULTISPECIES: T9SS type B sorting domain-containing protein [Zeaxanthinibacter]|uniref:T9SS type B sorting domain-containing protein n=1 Tax=Zeaxanthinibacter TaxID=561554 RepID=UPI00300E2D62